jgi:hypothetical protein
MKAFFTTSQRGKRYFEDYYLQIGDILKKLNLELIDDDIFVLTSDQFYKKLEKEGRDAYVRVYKRKIKSIQEADICIFECSINSLSTGFVLQKSLEMRKPTIALYYKDNMPYFLSGISDEKFLIHSYNNNNLQEILSNLINKTRSLQSSRFNFFISPRLLNYVEKASKRKNISKSMFIRDLISSHMQSKP